MNAPNMCFDNLPNGIESLDLDFDDEYHKTLDDLPDSLKYFKLSMDRRYKYPHKLNNLPYGIKVIETCIYNWKELIQVRPQELKTITNYNVEYKSRRNNQEQEQDEEEDIDD